MEIFAFLFAAAWCLLVYSFSVPRISTYLICGLLTFGAFFGSTPIDTEVLIITLPLLAACVAGDLWNSD